LVPSGLRSRGFFILMNRVIYLVDGFNLYHSIKDIQLDFGVCLKWLDIYALCKSYLHLSGKAAQLERVYYFTAYATHLNDTAVLSRHENYIKCLKATGIIPEFGRFKPKGVNCPRCGRPFVRYEEKETDVRIATKVFQLLSNDQCDTIILVTGDTDLTPAIEEAKQSFPSKDIYFAFPYKRANAELKNIAPKSFKIHRSNYARHQLPNPVSLPDGTQVYKPSNW